MEIGNIENSKNNFLLTLEDKQPTVCSSCVGWWKNNGVCEFTGNPPGTGGYTAAPVGVTVYTGPNAEQNCNNYGFMKNENDICIDDIGFILSE